MFGPESFGWTSVAYAVADHNTLGAFDTLREQSEHRPGSCNIAVRGTNLHARHSDTKLIGPLELSLRIASYENSAPGFPTSRK